MYICLCGVCLCERERAMCDRCVFVLGVSVYVVGMYVSGCVCYVMGVSVYVCGRCVCGCLC